MRVIISTQGKDPKLVVISTQTCALEPTVVPPVLLDLCSIVILHRFSSPTWWEHIIKHVPADFTANDAFDKVVRLPVLVLSDVLSSPAELVRQTGQAMVLAPSALGMFTNPDNGSSSSVSQKILAQFGRRYMIMKTRRRVTKDGGASILVVS